MKKCLAICVMFLLVASVFGVGTGFVESEEQIEGKQTLEDEGWDVDVDKAGPKVETLPAEDITEDTARLRANVDLGDHDEAELSFHWTEGEMLLEEHEANLEEGEPVRFFDMEYQEGIAYIATAFDDREFGDPLVFGLDVETGEIVFKHSDLIGVPEEIIVDENILYIAGLGEDGFYDNGYVQAYDREEEEILWEHQEHDEGVLSLIKGNEIIYSITSTDGIIGYDGEEVVFEHEPDMDMIYGLDYNDGVIYTSSMEEVAEHEWDHYFRAIDVDTEEVLWEEFVEPHNVGVRMNYVDGVIYTSSGVGVLSAFDTDEKEILWHHQIGEYIHNPPIYDPEEEVLYNTYGYTIEPGVWGGDKLAITDAETGEVKHRLKEDYGASYAMDDEELYVSYGDSKVRTFDPYGWERIDTVVENDGVYDHKLTDLQPETTYEYYTYVKSSTEDQGDFETFTTTKVPPEVETLLAEDVTESSATLQADVDLGGLDEAKTHFYRNEGEMLPWEENIHLEKDGEENYGIILPEYSEYTGNLYGATSYGDPFVGEGSVVEIDPETQEYEEILTTPGRPQYLDTNGSMLLSVGFDGEPDFGGHVIVYDLEEEEVLFQKENPDWLRRSMILDENKIIYSEGAQVVENSEVKIYDWEERKVLFNNETSIDFGYPFDYIKDEDSVYIVRDVEGEEPPYAEVMAVCRETYETEWIEPLEETADSTWGVTEARKIENELILGDGIGIFSFNTETKEEERIFSKRFPEGHYYVWDLEIHYDEELGRELIYSTTQPTRYDHIPADIDRDIDRFVTAYDYRKDEFCWKRTEEDAKRISIGGDHLYLFGFDHIKAYNQPHTWSTTTEHVSDSGTVESEITDLEPGSDYEYYAYVEGEDEGSITYQDTGDFETFTTAEEVFKLTIDSIEGGEVVKPGEGEFEYGEGTEIDLEATAAEGYHFVEWTGDVETVEDLGSADTTITMDEDKSVTAHFEVEEYTLTVNTEGEGEVEIEPDQTEYEHGEEVTLTAVPDEGWEFDEWTGDVPEDEEGQEITITMDEDKEITAVFEEEDEIPGFTSTLLLLAIIIAVAIYKKKKR